MLQQVGVSVELQDAEASTGVVQGLHGWPSGRVVTAQGQNLHLGIELQREPQRPLGDGQRRHRPQRPLGGVDVGVERRLRRRQLVSAEHGVVLELGDDKDVADVDHAVARALRRQRRPRVEPGLPQGLGPKVCSSPKAGPRVGRNAQDEDTGAGNPRQIGLKRGLHRCIAVDVIHPTLQGELGLAPGGDQIEAPTRRTKQTGECGDGPKWHASTGSRVWGATRPQRPRRR